MQAVFLAALIVLSARIITVFLSPLVGRTTIHVVLAVYGTFAVIWQLTYVYRVLAMKRAVLPTRQYSCSRRTGTPPGWAGRVR